MRKRALVYCFSAVFAASSIFPSAPPAQQTQGQQTGEPLQELQEQWRQIMKNEHNPAARKPNPDGKPTFGPERERRSSKYSKKRSTRRGSKYSKKRGTRHGSKYSRKKSKRTSVSSRKDGRRYGSKASGKSRYAGKASGKSRYAGKTSGKSRYGSKSSKGRVEWKSSKAKSVSKGTGSGRGHKKSLDKTKKSSAKKKSTKR